jgi:small conductance mechanosensitive channel
MPPLAFALIDWNRLAPLGYVLLYFFIAFLVSRIATGVARIILRVSHVAATRQRPSRERLQTLEGLLGSGIGVVAFVAAIVASVSLFVDASTLIWMMGLFSAAFGFGARPLVSDLIHGVGFLSRSTFDIGEKVEIFIPAHPSVQGVIEEVTLRHTLVRAPTGELYTVPNGEIRVIRNFSRGKFSSANVVLRVDTDDLPRALEALTPLKNEAFNQLSDLLEPWAIISGSGIAGRKTEITIVAKAAFGKAATLKLQILNLISERFHKENIALAD